MRMKMRKNGGGWVPLRFCRYFKLERESQLLIPMYDYCLPCKDCTNGCGGSGG